MKQQIQTLSIIGLFAIASAVAYLAYALVAFTTEIKQVRQDLPPLLDQVERIEKGIKIDAWLELAHTIHHQLPQ